MGSLGIPTFQAEGQQHGLIPDVVEPSLRGSRVGTSVSMSINMSTSIRMSTSLRISVNITSTSTSIGTISSIFGVLGFGIWGGGLPG